MPRLIAAFRRLRRSKGPSDRLTREELELVARGVRRLSEGLTRGRPLAGQSYLDHPSLLGAYLLYFWPVSYAQAAEVLRELGNRPRAALDIASGPGPMAMAALDAGASEVTALDRSERALGLARELAGSIGRSLTTRLWDASRGDGLPGGGQAWSLVTVGHGLNELWSDAEDRVERRARLCEALAGRLRKGGALVLIEPALRPTTRELLEVRDAMVGRGFAVRAPCLFPGGCPALEREVDWCHAQRAWHPPEALSDIISAAGLHKDALKMSYLVLAPKGEPWPSVGLESRQGGDTRLFRVVSETFEGHQRRRVIGCGPEGRLPIARSDGARSEANATFDRLERGDLFALDGAMPAAAGDGIKIIESTQVRLVAEAGEPFERQRI